MGGDHPFAKLKSLHQVAKRPRVLAPEVAAMDGRSGGCCSCLG